MMESLAPIELIKLSTEPLLFSFMKDYNLNSTVLVILQQKYSVIYRIRCLQFCSEMQYRNKLATSAASKAEVLPRHTRHIFGD